MASARRKVGTSLDDATVARSSGSSSRGTTSPMNQSSTNSKQLPHRVNTTATDSVRAHSRKRSTPPGPTSTARVKSKGQAPAAKVPSNAPSGKRRGDDEAAKAVQRRAQRSSSKPRGLGTPGARQSKESSSGRTNAGLRRVREEVKDESEYDSSRQSQSLSVPSIDASNLAPVQGSGGAGGARTASVGAANPLGKKGPSSKRPPARTSSSDKQSRPWTIFGSAPERRSTSSKKDLSSNSSAQPQFWDPTYFDDEGMPLTQPAEKDVPHVGDGRAGRATDDIYIGRSYRLSGSGDAIEPSSSSQVQQPRRSSKSRLSAAQPPPTRNSFHDHRVDVGRLDVARFNGYLVFKHVYLAKTSSVRLSRTQLPGDANPTRAAAAAAGRAWLDLDPSKQAPWHDAAFKEACSAMQASALARRKRRRVHRQRERQERQQNRTRPDVSPIRGEFEGGSDSEDEHSRSESI